MTLHPTALIHVKSLRFSGPLLPTNLGADCNLLAYAVVYEGTTIGDRALLAHHTLIREDCTIGEDFKLWSGSIVDYGCTIGDRVKIHCGCYLAQKTVIDSDVFLAPGVVCTNDRYPGNPASGKQMVGPWIRHHAQIGANATLLPNLTIGDHAVVGAGSVVTKDVPPYTLVVGNPARTMRRLTEDYFTKPTIPTWEPAWVDHP